MTAEITSTILGVLPVPSCRDACDCHPEAWDRDWVERRPRLFPLNTLSTLCDPRSFCGVLHFVQDDTAFDVVALPNCIRCFVIPRLGSRLGGALTPPIRVEHTIKLCDPRSSAAPFLPLPVRDDSALNVVATPNLFGK